MPERYGSIAKVYVSPDGEIDNNSPSSILSNPKYISDYSSDQDEISFREDIMSLQMRIQNQEDYSKYMSSPHFTLASNSSQNYCEMK
jgi:hypothetical protein